MKNDIRFVLERYHAGGANRYVCPQCGRKKCFTRYVDLETGEYVAEDKKDVYTGAVGGDRRNGLGLHGADRKLIEAAGPANKNSIVVLIGGNMIMLEGWKDSVASILMGYYPGMEGGTALGKSFTAT